MGKPRAVLLCRQEQGLPHNLDQIRQYADVTVVGRGQLGPALPGAEVLLLWDFFSNELKDCWTEATGLKWIHVAAAGVDGVLFHELRSSPVQMTNANGIFDRPIAEFVLAAILAHDKQLHLSKRLQQRKIWRHRELTGTATTHALIVGTGPIGRATARLLRMVGVDVRGVGRTARNHDRDFGTVLAFNQLADQVGWADHLILLAPLTEQTHHCVDSALLRAMKPSAHLVNLGRGALVNEHDLELALRDGELAAASLDVFEQEPLPQAHPFWAMENVHISAHMSGDVKGWRDALANQFLEKLRAYCDGLPFQVTIDKERGYARFAEVPAP